MRLVYLIGIIVIAALVSYYLISVYVLQEQAINKQSVYVHLQPEWNSYPTNIVYDITNVWDRDEYTQLSGDDRLQITRERNVDELRYVHGKSYILIQHDNTNCHDVWEPHYARFGADVMRHHIEYLSGIQQSADSNVILYTLLPSNQDLKVHQTQVKEGYSQFIPICTDRKTSSFDYSLRINDPSVGFDVYFVPSIEEQQKYDEGENFDYYEDCFGINYVRFSGTCDNVDKNSGLLIVVPDNLTMPLTKFDVWLYEK